ncbi:MAG: M20/M25/M40 family metallo-hydrolase [Deltaproteobacteria bacterium]|nr:M20/M25/M40 family metallo-hydrolase [Deltaproteobacteria bacterium]
MNESTSQPLYDVVELTRRLCAIPSITLNEAAVVAEMKALLEAVGYDVKSQNVGGTPGRDNLYATKGTPAVLLTTHLDTVPPHFDVCDDADDDGAPILRGRGVCDAKGIAAAMICAAQKLSEKDEERVGLLFVVGEETDSDGARTLQNSDFVPPVHYFINGEPTDLLLTRAMKGAMCFELEVEGKAAHSAYPELGKSAIHQLVCDVHKLLEHPWPQDDDLGATTLNAGVIEGGLAPNVIAPHASSTLMMRTTRSAEELIETIESIKSESTRLLVRSGTGPVHLMTVDGHETCVVSFGSDVPYLSGLGKGLLIGPGSIHDAHTSHEKIRIEDLHKSVSLYVELATCLLAKVDSLEPR